MDQHYNPIIYQRLKVIFNAHDWNALLLYLNGLSNAHFRTAGYIIGERILPTVEREVFWDVAKLLILWQPRAFVVTIAKAATPRLEHSTLSIDDEGFIELAEALQDESHVIDRRKLLTQWLPAINRPQTMEYLFERMGISDSQLKIEYLLRTPGSVAGFLLLRTLCFEEHDRELLERTCRLVMKRGDAFSFNLASLLRSFFDLQEVRGTFSLQLQPYELSRLSNDFDAFSRTLEQFER